MPGSANFFALKNDQFVGLVYHNYFLANFNRTQIEDSSVARRVQLEVIFDL